MNRNIYQKWRQYQNYAIIALISIICLCFLPFIGTTAGLAAVFPDTAMGWMIYVFTKVMVGVVNFLILYCFVSQGKYNIRDNPKYIEANEILSQYSLMREFLPQSPKQHLTSVYGLKGTTVFLTTALSTFTLTQAILTFDIVIFLTYLITIVMGIIFGVLQMGQEEIYWTDEYWRYAKYIQQQYAAEETKSVENEASPQKEIINNDTLHQTPI